MVKISNNKTINYFGGFMQISNLKNIVVLNNVDSNIVEEAFVILKPNVRFNSGLKSSYLNFENKALTNEEQQKLDIEKNKNNDGKNEFILKQAEEFVNSYVKDLEMKNDKSFFEKKLERRCKILKMCNALLITLCIGIILILK
jgi:hypothetical protein